MGEIAPFLVPIVVPSVLFLSIATAVILRGPLGKAIGERVAGRKLDGDSAAQAEALHAEVDELRFRLSEVEERLDFTERLLARQGGPDALPREEH